MVRELERREVDRILSEICRGSLQVFRSHDVRKLTQHLGENYPKGERTQSLQFYKAGNKIPLPNTQSERLQNLGAFIRIGRRILLPH